MNHRILFSIFVFVCSPIFAQSTWGEWQKTDCLNNLEFRVKRGDYNQYSKNYKWHIEFKNNYNQTIHFNWIIVEYERKEDVIKNDKTAYRIKIDGNGTIISRDMHANSANSVYIYINRIKFGVDDFSKTYYKCDK